MVERLVRSSEAELAGPSSSLQQPPSFHVHHARWRRLILRDRPRSSTLFSYFRTSIRWHSEATKPHRHYRKDAKNFGNNALIQKFLRRRCRRLRSALPHPHRRTEAPVAELPHNHPGHQSRRSGRSAGCYNGPCRNKPRTLSLICLCYRMATKQLSELSLSSLPWSPIDKT